MEDKVKSKMSRASSLPAASKHYNSNTSTSSNRVNAPTQAEVVKNRILKTEAQSHMLQDLLKHGNFNKTEVKVESDYENPNSPYIDVEALSDGDEKIECDQGNIEENMFIQFYLACIIKA